MSKYRIDLGRRWGSHVPFEMLSSRFNQRGNFYNFLWFRHILISYVFLTALQNRESGDEPETLEPSSCQSSIGGQRSVKYNLWIVYTIYTLARPLPNGWNNTVGGRKCWDTYKGLVNLEVESQYAMITHIWRVTTQEILHVPGPTKRFLCLVTPELFVDVTQSQQRVHLVFRHFYSGTADSL